MPEDTEIQVLARIRQEDLRPALIREVVVFLAVVAIAIGLVQATTLDWRVTCTTAAVFAAAGSIELRFPHFRAFALSALVASVFAVSLILVDGAVARLAWILVGLLPLAVLEAARMSRLWSAVTETGNAGILVRNGFLEHALEPNISVATASIDPEKVFLLKTPFFGEPRIDVVTEFGRRISLPIRFMTPSGEEITTQIVQAVRESRAKPIDLAAAAPA